MKKCIICLVVIFAVMEACVVFAYVGEMEFAGSVDVGDQVLKVYTKEMISGGRSIQKKIVVIKDGKDIFPEYFPGVAPFVKNGYIDFTYFGSYGGFAIDKYDNYPGQQIMFFQPGETLYESGAKAPGCWQTDLTDNLEGNTVKRVFVHGYFFRYTGIFEFYKEDVAYYLTNNIPDKKNIPKMFKKETEFSRAYKRAEAILNALKRSEWQRARELGLANQEVISYITKWNVDMKKFTLHTWCSGISNEGYCFYEHNKDGSGISITVGWDIKTTKIIIR